MMTELELLTILKNQLNDSIKYANDDFKNKNKSLTDSYNQEKYGNEEPGHSQVIASDHYDMVESDMPALARVFLGPSKILGFKPFGKDDVEEAKQKTDYADYIIRSQRDSFKIIHDFLKEPGFSKCSIIKFYPDEIEKPEYVMYEGLSEDELTLLMQDLEAGDDVEKVEIESQDEIKAKRSQMQTLEGEVSEPSETRYNVRFRVVKKTKKITLVNVPPESFIISRGADDKDTAAMIGDECTKTKGQLVAEGFDKEMIRKLPPMQTERGEEVRQDRFEDQGGWDYKSGYHWTNEQVVIQNLYPLVDYDEDGIPERRFIMKCGEKILQNEPYGIAPYAINSQILMPHTAIGKSRGEQAQRYQLEKTAIKRGIMDNVYSVNRPRMAVDDSAGSIDGGKVDLDDLAVHRINGYVRVDGSPHEALMPLVVPYIGDSALQVVQYLDTEKSNSLGAQLANQGLSSDKFYKETATRFEGIEESAQAKIELVARVYAETGFRQLYEGVIWTAQHYQDTECEIMVLGKEMTVDPRKWRYEHYCQSQVGLGAGDSAEAIENLGAMLQTQTGLLQTGSPLVDSKKIYNTLDDLARALGKPDTSRYYNDPEVPEEQLMAENEQMKAMLSQAQQMMQDPYLKAEEMKAQAKLMEAQSKQELDAKKFMMDMQKWQQEFQQQQREFQQQMAFQLTKLEVDSNKDIPGSTV
jgi:hypothetical protein